MFDLMVNSSIKVNVYIVSWSCHLEVSSDMSFSFSVEMIIGHIVFSLYSTVIQFGFITIFVAAFPLAPFFALANNIFEIRIDSNKLVCETRRPIAERAQDLGVWFNILEAVAKIAVISNVSLIEEK